MELEKALTINLSGYETPRTGVSDAGSSDECDGKLAKEIRKIDLPVSNNIHRVILGGLND